jgi:excisionase family DNA binding protein
MKKYLSVNETAEYLSTSVRFIRRLITERRIAFHKVGRHVRISVEDLEQFVLAGRVEAFDRSAIHQYVRRAS